MAAFWAAILGSRSWTKLWGFGIKPIVQDSAPNPLFTILQEQRRILINAHTHTIIAHRRHVTRLKAAWPTAQSTRTELKHEM
jgi:hypothetical protein